MGAARKSGAWKKAFRVLAILLSIPVLTLVIWTGWTMYSLTPGQTAREEQRLLAAVEKSPAYSEAHLDLGAFYSRKGHYEKDPVLRKKWCRLSSDEFTLALDYARSEISRCWLLPDVAASAFENGEYERARRIAAEMVVRATPPVAHPWEDCNRGNSIHQGHMILGKVALKRGNVSAAKRELLLAGQTPGSPQLDSFGPNMSLARELLERGERDTVLAYFDECGTFWKGYLSKLGGWRKTVKAGGIPNFGANLYY